MARLACCIAVLVGPFFGPHIEPLVDRPTAVEVPPIFAIDWTNGLAARDGTMPTIATRASDAYRTDWDGTRHTMTRVDPNIIRVGSLNDATGRTYTNLLLDSNGLDQGPWTFASSSGSLVSGNTDAFGTANNAWGLNQGFGTAELSVAQSVRVESGTQYTLSIFTQQPSGSHRVYLDASGAAVPGGAVTQWYNVSAQTVSVTGDPDIDASSISQFSNPAGVPWYRASLTFTASVDGDVEVKIGLSSFDGGSTADFFSGFVVSAAQFNEGVLVDYSETTDQPASIDTLSGVRRAAQLESSAATNLVLDSATMATAGPNWSGVRAEGVASATELCPDGVTPAVELRATSTVSASSMRIRQTVAVANATQYSVSVQAKLGPQASGPTAYLQSTNMGAGTANALYSLVGDGLVNASSNTDRESVWFMGAGWYEIDFAATSNSTSSIFEIWPTSGAIDLNVGDVYLFLCFSQFEAGAVPSSRITTTSAAVTRAADTVIYPNPSGADRPASPRTWSVTALTADWQSGGNLLTTRAGAATEAAQIRLFSGVRGQHEAGGSTVATATSSAAGQLPPLGARTWHDVRLPYSDTQFQIQFDFGGTQVSGRAVANTPGIPDGASLSIGDAGFNGWIGPVVYSEGANFL